MFKTKKYSLFLFLICFSIYCALIIGQAWDEGHLIAQGKISLDYLLSLGRINIDLFQREYYSPIYYSIRFLLTQILPANYQIEAGHLINLFFSITTIIGIKKLSKEFFNENVGKIVFLVLFFYPIFFGHMSLNSKDTIIAFCHVWIFYFSIQYLRKQNIKGKANKFVYLIAILTATGTGINLFFLGSLIPILLFLVIDIIFLKKFICKNFNIKKLFIDFFRFFIIFYFLLILFWIDTHQNIFYLPYNFFVDFTFGDAYRGVSFNLLNGEYFLYKDTPKSYLFISLIHKSPEYFLLSYLIFVLIYFKSKNFFDKKFSFFNYKLLVITATTVFPFLIVFFLHFSLYDGVRHFLWMLPYFCIIPSLAIYYLIENIKFLESKITLTFLSLLIVYFLYNFFIITPYQYTYLNIFNGKIENRYKKFENDYWGASTKELIANIKFDKIGTINFATCGINHNVAKYYLKKRGYLNVKFGKPENSKYIIMTNRVTLNKDNIWENSNLINCFDKFKGKDLFSVKRNGVLLSVIRKVN